MYLKIAYIRFIIFGTNPKTIKKLKKELKMTHEELKKLTNGFNEKLNTLVNNLYFKVSTIQILTAANFDTDEFEKQMQNIINTKNLFETELTKEYNCIINNISAIFYETCFINGKIGLYNHLSRKYKIALPAKFDILTNMLNEQIRNEQNTIEQIQNTEKIQLDNKISLIIELNKFKENELYESLTQDQLEKILANFLIEKFNNIELKYDNNNHAGNDTWKYHRISDTINFYYNNTPNWLFEFNTY